MPETVVSFRRDPEWRRRAFVRYSLGGGVFFVAASIYYFIHYSSYEHLDRLSGEVLKTEFHVIPRTEEPGSRDRYDLNVFLAGIEYPVVFRSFIRAETHRIRDALQPGQLAELDIDSETFLIWGVTSDNVMYLSPTHTRAEKYGDLYLLLSMGILMILSGVIVWALPKRGISLAQPDARTPTPNNKPRQQGRANARPCSGRYSPSLLTRLIALALVHVLCSCAPAPVYPPARLDLPYEVLGAQVFAPNQAGWKLLSHSNLEIVFVRMRFNSTTDSAVANTRLFWVDEFDDSRSFLEHVISLREIKDDNDRFLILGSEKEFITYKGADCFRYRTVSKDYGSRAPTEKSFQYFRTRGQVCRHPANPALAFQAEVSYRANDPEVPQWVYAAQEYFINEIVFVNNKVR